MVTSTQTRDKVFHLGARIDWETPVGAGSFDSTSTAKLNMRQETTSFRSRADDDTNPQALLEEQEIKNRASNGDTGHEFKTRKQELVIYPGYRNVVKHDFETNNHLRFHGSPYLAKPGSEANLKENFPVAYELDSDEINYYGSKLINSSLPTKSTANLAVTLGEAMQDLPEIPLAAAGALVKGFKGRSPVRGTAQDFLNLNFGWAPVISDIQKLCEAVINANKIISDYVGNSGLLVHRKRSEPTRTTVTTEKNQSIKVYGAGPMTDSNYFRAWLNLGGMPVTDVGGDIISRRTDQIWFSGAFSYLVDPGGDLMSKLNAAEQLANKLLGTRLTPEVLWELTPFSWLLDWKLNIGTLITNASYLGKDGLVMPYGYLMVKTQVDKLMVHDGSEFRLPGEPKSRETRTIWRETAKRRYRATPYGFGKNPNDFNVKQWGILAALGITLAPRRLKRPEL